MHRFVKAEIFKLYKDRTFRVLCIVSLVVAVFSLSMLKLVSSESFIKSSLKGMTQEQQQQFMNQLKSAGSSNGKIQPGNIGMHIDSKDMFHPTGDEIFHAAFGSGIIEIFLAVLIGAVVAKEYTSGTIKNSIAYGKKREYYYLSKIVSIFIGMIILLTIQVLVVTLGFSIISGWVGAFTLTELFKMIGVFLAAVVVGMGTASLLILLSTLIKSSGATIGIGIGVFCILPMVVAFLYGKFSWFDKIYNCTVGYNWALATSVKASSGDVLKAAAVGLVTLIISTVLGIMVFKKQDIK